MNHFGHERIIKYCNRPFNSVEEMDEEIIKKHNEVVQKKDFIYFLGDFTLKHYDEMKTYLDRMNGEFTFIRGNHDYKWLRNYPGRIYDIHEKSIRGQKIIMCHYPMLSWNSSSHGSLHIFGHSHGKTKGMKNSMDVGVDCWNFYPVSFDQIKGKK